VLDEDRVFLETTRRLAPPSLALEDARNALELLRPALGASPRVADLGCGYGRHLAAFAKLGLAKVVGVDKSALLLGEARKLAPASSLIRSDLRALPLVNESLDGAACFYSSMFLGTAADSVAALAEARRVLKQGGLLVLTTDNPLRLQASPRAAFQDELPGLGQVREESQFDASSGIDVVRRSIEGAEATFRIRYYLPPELARLALAAGLRLLRLHPDAELTAETPQMIALLTPN
jgi:SAM-dependent methyltransferase